MKTENQTSASADALLQKSLAQGKGLYQTLSADVEPSTASDAVVLTAARAHLAAKARRQRNAQSQARWLSRLMSFLAPTVLASCAVAAVLAVVLIATGRAPIGAVGELTPASIPRESTPPSTDEISVPKGVSDIAPPIPAHRDDVCSLRNGDDLKMELARLDSAGCVVSAAKLRRQIDQATH